MLKMEKELYFLNALIKFQQDVYKELEEKEGLAFNFF